MISTMPVYAKKQSNTFLFLSPKGVYISSPFGYRIHPISGKRVALRVDIGTTRTLVHAIADGELQWLLAMGCWE